MPTRSEQPYPRTVSDAAVAAAPGGLVPARTPLAGRQVTLMPLDPAQHGAPLYRASHGDTAARAIWDFLPWGPWPDEDGFRAFLRAQAAALDRVTYALVPAGSADACGMASYLDIQPAAGVIEIGGIWFAPGLQRTRAATEAMYLMLCYAFDGLRYRRLQWRCNALNQRSRRAAARLSFRFEGIFFNHIIVKGRNRDTAWYSILDTEWPAARRHLETWLDDANFDESGRARRSLGAMIQEQRP